jgi:hypothetical protein
MLNPGLLENFFQFGYITPNIEAGMAVFRERFNVPEFLVFPNGRSAAVWIGETLIEISNPLEKYASIYAHAMPKSGIALHHLGYRVREESRWLEIMAELEASGLPTTKFDISPSVGLQNCFVDTRPLLGHYIEFLWTKAGMPDFFRNVPRAPAFPN